MNNRLPDDRLPVVEWAVWWDKTLARFQEEGLDPSLDHDGRYIALGLDVHRQYGLPHMAKGCPQPASHGAAIMDDEADYENIKRFLYPEDAADAIVRDMHSVKAQHDAGEIVFWMSMEGAFWFPRTLFGIENHLFSFYDYPELYHRILDDLAQFQICQMEKVFAEAVPEFVMISEDMSYNLGPMLSEEMFDEFLAPYYRKVVPWVHSHGSKVILDSDGDVTMMVPWLRRMGIDGILPLEHQAGVDLVKMKQTWPDFILMGGFDKMVMKHGEEAMRAEFERILPAMKAGGYLPGVDHQTPPDVSLENYRIYVRLLNEYARKAVE